MKKAYEYNRPSLDPASVQESIRKQQNLPRADYSNKQEKAAALAAIPGHPLQTLSRENEALHALITEAKARIAAGSDLDALPGKIRELSVHYAKKGDLLYPLLKTRYGIEGPSDMMWTDDDEIRDELNRLSGEERDEAWLAAFAAVLRRAEEMLYKENKILFPMCAVNFAEEEWMGIYRDSGDYGSCLGVTGETWEAAEAAKPAPVGTFDGEIVMPGGHLTLPQLTALLNTIPMEITFVDAENINRFFNEGPKAFKRPGMAIDREVFSCHPPKVEPMVRAIIEDFRAGRRDRVPVWSEKGGRCMLVTYLAVRDRAGEYLGTVELVQDMEFAREHFAKQTAADAEETQ